MTGWKAIEERNLCQICWFCLFQVVLQIESDEHIFKFLKSKFGYGIGRYVSYNKMKCHPLLFLFVNATFYEPWVKTWSLSNHDDVDDNYNVKKKKTTAIGFMSKTITLHMRHAF